MKTQGFDGSSVQDLNALSSSISEVLIGLLKNARVKVKLVQLGFGGGLIRVRRSSAVMPLLDRGNRVISKKDIAKIHEQARLLGMKMDEIILHDFPQAYKVDDVNQAVNPIGLYGRKLEAEVLMVTVNNTIVKNLIKAVNQAGFDVDNVFFTACTGARTALTDAERQQGCAVVDFGATVTDIAIFRSGQLRFLDSIPYGSDEVTRAIARTLNISWDMAEDMKKSYVVVRHEQPSADEEVLIKTEDGYVPVKKNMMSESIEPVVIDLLNMVKASIKRSGWDGQLAAGMVVSGGGSLLSGFAERLDQDIAMPVKLAKIPFTSKRMHHAVKFLSPIGLARAGFDRNASLLTKKGEYSNWVRMALERTKEIYEEYF